MGEWPQLDKINLKTEVYTDETEIKVVKGRA